MFKTKIKTKTSWSKTKPKTKTFIFVLEAPRDQDPDLEDYITASEQALRLRLIISRYTENTKTISDI